MKEKKKKGLFSASFQNHFQILIFWCNYALQLKVFHNEDLYTLNPQINSGCLWDNRLLDLLLL